MECSFTMWEEEDQLQFAMQQLAIVPIPFHGYFSEFFQFPPTNYSDDQNCYGYVLLWCGTHNALKSTKKCNFGSLPQKANKIKGLFFKENFFLTVPFGVKKFFSKNKVDFSQNCIFW